MTAAWQGGVRNKRACDVSQTRKLFPRKSTLLHFDERLQGKLFLFHSSESTSCLRLCFGLWSAFVSWSACCGRSTLLPEELEEEDRPLALLFLLLRLLSSLSDEGRPMFTPVTGSNREKSIDCRNQYSFSEIRNVTHTCWFSSSSHTCLITLNLINLWTPNSEWQLKYPFNLTWNSWFLYFEICYTVTQTEHKTHVYNVLKTREAHIFRQIIITTVYVGWG